MVAVAEVAVVAKNRRSGNIASADAVAAAG